MRFTRLAGEIRQLGGDREHRLSLRVPDDWDEQAEIGVDGDADVVIVLDHQLASAHVDTGIERGKRLERTTTAFTMMAVIVTFGPCCPMVFT